MKFTQSCRIHEKKIYRNEALFYSDQALDDKTNFKTFIKGAYKYLGQSYPKFFKMDRLSKLGFIAASVLFSDRVLSAYAPEEIAVVMANRHSTLVTDTKHCESIKNREAYFPSPSVFVYTLPNILVGEICIRYGFKGENAFFISNQFDQDFMYQYANLLFQSGETKACLVGWVDYKDEADYSAILHLLET